MTDDSRKPQVNRHYGRPRLGESILDALASMGQRLETLTPADLAPVDEFHVRGLVATRELARKAGIRPGDRVLDVGGGLGGPARILASEFRARVEVLDLTEEFCRSGRILTQGLRLEEWVTFRHGSALEMPNPEESVDVVWMQHCSMNIEDKAQLFKETHRVLRPGGRLAFHEILSGTSGPLHFPVPWAEDPELSFVSDQEEFETILGDLGFRPRLWEDSTQVTVEWFRERFASAAKANPSPLGLHLIHGDRTGTPFQTMLRNLEEGRVRDIQSVWDRE